MTSKSVFNTKNPMVLLFSIFYIVVGIVEVGYWALENFSAPPHIVVLGILSLITAYGFFRMKKNGSMSLKEEIVSRRSPRGLMCPSQPLSFGTASIWSAQSIRETASLFTRKANHRRNQTGVQPILQFCQNWEGCLQKEQVKASACLYSFQPWHSLGLTSSFER